MKARGFQFSTSFVPCHFLAHQPLASSSVTLLTGPILARGHVRSELGVVAASFSLLIAVSLWSKFWKKILVRCAELDFLDPKSVGKNGRNLSEVGSNHHIRHGG